MNEFELIFLAGGAIFLGYKLWSVLGRTNGDEASRAAEANAFLEKQAALMAEKRKGTSPAYVAAAEKPLPMEEGIPEHLVEDVKQARKYDSSFTLKEFKEGSAGAFEMVIEGFAKGKNDALKFLLSKELYKDFEKEITKREKKELEAVSSVVSMGDPEIIDIEFKGSVCQVMVKFVSEQINFIKDKAGEIIEGSKSQIDHVTDVWTFERDLKSNKPNWTVVGTQG